MERSPNDPRPTPRPVNQPGQPPAGAGGGSGPSKIRHTESTLGRTPSATGPGAGGGDAAGEERIVPVPVPVPVPTTPGAPGNAPPVNREIRTFGSTVDSHQEDHWQRAPRVTGSGATHCKTFHSKLTEDALRYMDQLINEWLDAHPDYEVKFVNSSIGTFTGKLKEPHLICQVWV